MSTGRGSGDSVLRTDADIIEHAIEMDTSDLQLTSIMMAATSPITE